MGIRCPAVVVNADRRCPKVENGERIRRERRKRSGCEGGKGSYSLAVVLVPEVEGRDDRSRGGMIDAFASLDFNMGRRVLGATCPYFVTHHTVTFVTASFIYCVVSLVVVSLVVHVHVIE
jgi:hypothetical protein